MRSMKTIRYLLPRIERVEDLEIDEDELQRNLEAMWDADLITGMQACGDGQRFFERLELDVKGMELLSVINNEGMWEEILKRVDQVELDIDTIPLKVIQELGNDVMKEMLGIGMWE